MNPGTPEVQTTPDIRSESWQERGGKQKSHPKKEDGREEHSKNAQLLKNVVPKDRQGELNQLDIKQP